MKRYQKTIGIGFLSAFILTSPFVVNKASADSSAKEKDKIEMVSELKINQDNEMNQKIKEKTLSIISSEDILARKNKSNTYFSTLNLEDFQKSSGMEELNKIKTLKEFDSFDTKYKQLSEEKTRKDEEAKRLAEEARKKAEAERIKAENLKKAKESNQTKFTNQEDQTLLSQLNNTKIQNLSEWTSKMKEFLGTKFNVTSFSLYRPGDYDGTGHGHGNGLAIDLMVDNAKGDKIAEYLVNNFNELKIYYIIWEQKFYMNSSNIYGPANSWNLMPDRGGITANHYDHVHISFKI